MMAGKASLPLSGLRVWVTRPAHQAEPLCAAIEAAGGHALRQPLLAIAASGDPIAAGAGLAAAESADALIFTSANAVDRAWALRPGFRPRGTLHAVGAATRRALQTRSPRSVTAPQFEYSSEGVLAQPVLAAPAGWQIVIITGEGGRGKLTAGLGGRGARVAEVAVYRRRPVAIERRRLLALLEEADALVITSSEALTHLMAITPRAAADRLRRLQLVVPSSRVVKQAAQLGFVTPLRPERMDDAAMVEALARWAS